VDIPQGKIVGDAYKGYYAEMKDNAQYTLVLQNKTDIECDCEVKIDGKVVGCWRINPYDRIEIERPVNEPKKFTFLKVETAPSEAGFVKGKSENGLVDALFIPEKRQRRPLCPRGVPGERYKEEEGLSFRYRDSVPTFGATATSFSVPASYSYSEGATALRGHSSQTFSNASHIERDTEKQVRIVLRLVAVDEEDKITPLREAHGYSTAVPPPVGFGKH
jgi:hypothetical protein